MSNGSATPSSNRTLVAADTMRRLSRSGSALSPRATGIWIVGENFASRQDPVAAVVGGPENVRHALGVLARVSFVIGRLALHGPEAVEVYDQSAGHVGRHRGAGRITSLLLLMIYFVFGAPTWGVRPQVLSTVFLGAFYLLLMTYKMDTARARLLWLLPVLTALWVNMHPSFVIGLALVGAFALGEWANNYLYRPGQPVPSPEP